MGELSSGTDMPPTDFYAAELNSGWSFRQTDSNEKDDWLPVKKIPSEVHLDLIDNKRYMN